MLTRDVVVLDRAEAQTLDDEARRLVLSLRNAERLTHDSKDDRLRMVYAEIRDALGAARWLSGGIAEALS